MELIVQVVLQLAGKVIISNKVLGVILCIAGLILINK
jgi:hypothetical protein